MTAKQVLSALREVARDDKAAFLPGFFQAVSGGYGEGDRLLGCVVPDQRKVARQFRDLSRDELLKLFASPWHVWKFEGRRVKGESACGNGGVNQPRVFTDRAAA